MSSGPKDIWDAAIDSLVAGQNDQAAGIVMDMIEKAGSDATIKALIIGRINTKLDSPLTASQRAAFLRLRREIESK